MTIINKLTIIGLGMMGGSLAIAAREKSLAKQINAYNKSIQSLDYAKEQDIINFGSQDLPESVKDSDLIVICTPLSTYEQIFKTLSKCIKSNCIISDIGSVKQYPVEIAEKYLNTDQLANFVPAHPIAGLEKTGMTAAISNLYKNKKTILTPTKNTFNSAVKVIEELWQGLDSKTEILAVKEHDDIYASVSHLPQFLLFAYNNLLESNKILPDVDNQDFQRFYRIANSNPDMWQDIFKYNKPALERHLKQAKEIILQTPTSTENSSIDFEITNIIPQIIAKSIIQTDYKDYAGSGFSDVTSILSQKITHNPSSNALKALLYEINLLQNSFNIQE